jgi:hypothetical protein
MMNKIPGDLRGNCTRFFFLAMLLSMNFLSALGQRVIKAVVADSLSKQPLAFATIRIDNQNTFITGINGQFTLELSVNAKQLHISYVSYNERIIPAAELRDNDTIFLSSSASTLGEVIVRPQTDKIRRIINKVIRNKSSNNPEMYAQYTCNIYYKTRLDMLPIKLSASDSAKRRPPQRNGRVSVKVDSGPDSADLVNTLLNPRNHFLFSETYSKRFYRRPDQYQDIVLASRFSGLKKSYFANLVTNVLPFHIYTDLISLGGIDYVNPVARGWQHRYSFYIADEIVNGTDTTFILAFQPKKNAAFKSLKGLIYVNTDGYAISHFIGATADTSSNREIKLEQVYEKVDGKWFPSELNYDATYGNNQNQGFIMAVKGLSRINSVSFIRTKDFKFNRAYTAKLHDSVDLRSDQYWENLRTEPLTSREKNTYQVVDSISEVNKVEKIISKAGKMSLGLFPIGIFDLNMSRFFSSSDYEGIRLGAGLYTNERVSKYYSIGGWAGYGFKDKVVKYGLNATIFPKANREHWIRVAYDDDYQNAGNIRIHKDIDRGGYRNWILSQVDHKREFSLTAQTHTGFLELELTGISQMIESRYQNNFEFGGKNYQAFDVMEAGLGLRFAYGEKRIPMFGYYFPIETKYPIVYLRSALGSVESGDYSARYARALIGISFDKRLNRWGKDMLRIEAGMIHAFNREPFSRSLLLAAKGFRRSGLNYYAWGGFLTMHPYDYYTDRYFSFMYKHDFDKTLWRTKRSKPYVSLAHNFMYGGLGFESKLANAGITAPVSGFHESGILLNQLLQINLLGAINVYFNGGAFYHWTSSIDWKQNGLFVLGVSAGL